MTDIKFLAHPRDYPIGSANSADELKELLGYAPARNDFDWIRIAWHDKLVIAAYHVKPLEGPEYLLRALAVRAPYRGRGIGRWMLTHALGVIESKGGRSVLVCSPCSLALYEKLGFKRVAEHQYRLNLEPE